MIATKNLNELEAEQKQATQQKIDSERAAQQPEVVDALASYVKSKWEIAKSHKLDITHRLSDNLRRRKGEYSPEKLSSIQGTGGSEIYMNITGIKCMGAKAWLSDLFNPSGDKPFTLEPTPIMDLPPELHERLIMEAMKGAMALGIPEEVAFQLMQKHKDRLKGELRKEAEDRMELMEDHIEDALIEGNWRTVFDNFLDDLVTYPTAIISGVNFKQKSKITWVEINGEYQPKKQLKLSRETSRVSPFDAYPSPTMNGTDSSWFIEHIRYSAADLSTMRTAQGYDPNAIENVLTDYRINGHREWLFNSGERDRLEGKTSVMSGNYDLIDGVKFTGNVQGKQLIEWGMDKAAIKDPLDEYSVSMIVIGSYAIRALVNPDPSGKMPYYFTSWRNVPNSFWGQSLPETIADIQDAANATARALINNMAMGSAPQVAVDVACLPANTAVTSLTPWKVWTYDSNKNGGRGAGVSFFSPEIKSQELLGVYERFVRYSDELSGIPSYAFGSDAGAGAAKTASGLSMLMNAASKIIKNVVRNVDVNVIEPLIGSFYNSLMLDPDVPKEIKGDAAAKARGSDSLMHKEASAMRQQELLQMTNNPTDLQITGMDGRKELLKEVYKSSDLPVDRMLPDQQMQAEMEAQAQGQEQAQAQGQPQQGQQAPQQQVPK
tara:strand:- start:172054 stop:174039 length:1986 start_codon:yes stop_codon:yes gene_type:complete